MGAGAAAEVDLGEADGAVGGATVVASVVTAVLTGETAGGVDALGDVLVATTAAEEEGGVVGTVAEGDVVVVAAAGVAVSSSSSPSKSRGSPRPLGSMVMFCSVRESRKGASIIVPSTQRLAPVNQLLPMKAKNRSGCSKNRKAM